MKKTFLFGLILCGLFAACQPDNVCIIEGRVQGVEDGTDLYLMRPNERGGYSIADTMVVQGGEFALTVTYTDKVVKPEMVILLLDDREKKRFGMLDNVYIAPGEKVSITGTGDGIYAWRVESDIAEQKYINQLTGKSYQYIVEQNRIYSLFTLKSIVYSRKKFKDYAEAEQMLKSVTSTYYPQMFAYKDSVVMAEIEPMQTLEVNELWMQRLLEHCGSIEFSKRYAHGGTAYPSYLNDLKALYKRMTPEQKATRRGKKIAGYLLATKMETVQVGDTLYDTDLYDLRGNVHRLSNYRGKYVLIDFWRASCGPCRQSIPELRRLGEEWKEVLHIVGISSDEKEVWRKVSEETDITWTNLNDLQGNAGIFTHYGVVGVPHYVIASPDGRILHTWAGYGKGIIEKNLKEWVKK